MKKVKFDDVIKDITGGNKKIKTTEYLDDGILPIIDQSSKFISGFTNEVNKVKTNRKDVIIFGDHTKEFKYINFDFCIGADGVKILEPINELNTKYLYYFFQTVYLPNVGYSRHFKFLKETEIPLPPLSQQKAIAAQLDKAQELVQYNEQLIEKYDELQQSLFLDMFGDPVINEKGWEKMKFNKLSYSLNSKRIPLKQADREKMQKTYPYYGASGIIDYVDDYLFDDINLLIGEDGANLLSRNTPIAFISKGKYWVNNHAHVIKNNNKSNLLYLKYYINSINLEKYITGSAQPKLNKSNLDNILINVPPLILQNDFAKKIESIEIQKEQAKEALAKSKDIFQGLLQEHFF